MKKLSKMEKLREAYASLNFYPILALYIEINKLKIYGNINIRTGKRTRVVTN